MVGAGEAAAAGQALEGLGTRVLPIVPGQLVGAGKAPVAAFPGAFIGLLACGEEPKVMGTAPPRKSRRTHAPARPPKPPTRPPSDVWPPLGGPGGHPGLPTAERGSWPR